MSETTDNTPVVKRLKAVNALVDAQHRPHWLQETCDLGAIELEHCRALNEELVEALRNAVNSECLSEARDVLAALAKSKEQER